jgi:hypothetical protein
VDTYSYGQPGRTPDSGNAFFGDLITEKAALVTSTS